MDLIKLENQLRERLGKLAKFEKVNFFVCDGANRVIAQYYCENYKKEIILDLVIDRDENEILEVSKLK